VPQIESCEVGASEIEVHNMLTAFIRNKGFVSNKDHLGFYHR
jgi:hypothetical protein